MASDATAGGGRGIAIIGMACIFPGAHSPEELWRNVLAGRREFRRLPAERMPRSDYFDPDPAAPLRTYSDQMAVITGWRFDPVDFRIPPITVEASDITHWLALHTARTALQDAGLDLDGLDRTRIGVMLGNSLGGEFARSHNLKLRWPYVERSVRAALDRSGVAGEAADALVDTIGHYYHSRLPDATEDTLAGNMSNTIAGRIAGYFDLGGGAFTLDGACSSSLLAVATACNALVDGELDWAVAGGVDVSLDPFELIGFAKTRALAKDDIRPYDEHAAGMLPGEGCGLFVLMREEEARRSGYPVRAVLRGWGVSSDGAGGITAPGVDGQQRALRQAYRRAGYTIGDVQLIEGHGTGTPLGDRVELTSIRGLLEDAPGEQACWIGSIKSNIGHCKAAAGAAGLVKAVMALRRRIIPPTAACDRPNPIFRREPGRLRPATTGRPWLAAGPRRASVSAMGFGGANAHVTLEEAEPGDAISQEDLGLLGSAQTTELVLVAAADEAELMNRARRVAAVADRISRSQLVDLAAALAASAAEQVRSDRAAVRFAVVAATPWQLADALRAVVRQVERGEPLDALGRDDVTAGQVTSPGTRPTLVALYAGQGSQRLGMGEHLLRRHDPVRRFFEEVETATRDVLDRPLRGIVHPDLWLADEAAREARERELTDTRVAQPAIVAGSLATLRVLERVGLVPDLHIGHSLGEVTALCAAGGMDDLTAVRIAALRGRAMAGLEVDDPGAMLAIAAPPERVESLVEDLPGAVVSNYNSPRQTVAAGATEAVRELERRCEAEGLRSRRVAVSHAFHSDIVAPAARQLAVALADVAMRPLTGTVVSTATGNVLDPDTDLRALLSEHVRRPVRFTDAVRRAQRESPALWVEVGPGAILSSLVRDTLGPDVPCLPTDVAGEDGFDRLNRVFAAAFVRGFDLRLEEIFAGRYIRPLDPETHDPEIIVNPCERPVEEPALTRAIELDSLPVPTPAVRGANGGGVSPDTRATGHLGGAADADGGSSLEDVAIDWIATRTGFPRESITADMRLRDDLNLDSIKVGELGLMLSKRVGGSAGGDPAAMANARIAELVSSLTDVASPAPDDGPIRNAYSSARIIERDWVSTFGTAVVAAPLGSTGRGSDAGSAAPTNGARRPAPRIEGRVAVLEAGEGAGPVADTLRSLGLRVVAPDDRRIQEDAAPADLAGIVVILPEEGGSFLGCDPPEFDRRVRSVSDRLYHALRWAMRGAGGAVRCIVVRPAGERDPAKDLDGGAGLLRTFFLENPGSTARWLRTPGGWSAREVAEVVARELAAEGPSGSFAYDAAGERRTEIAVPLATPTPTRLRLDARDAAFVTGGGKGITAELALALARETGVRLVLAGSSPPPPPNADPASDELARNFDRFREAGVVFTYVQCDVTDPASVAAAVERAEAEVGPVTVLLHGAGITQFAALRDKSYDEFRRCIEVKVHGLYNLLRALPPQRLKAVHVLSSVLGRTGMRSQADYTMANAWLDSAVLHLADRFPHLHALSLCYSVWEGAGLGDRLGALDFLKSVGVTPIPVARGVAAYLTLVREGHGGSSFVVTGRLSPDLEAQLYGAGPTGGGRYIERVRHWVPGVELVAEATLSFERDPYLPEHVYDGTPLFPGVMAMEAMAQAACALMQTDQRPVLHNVRFDRPLIVSERSAVVIRVVAMREDGPEGSRVGVRIRSDADDFRADHFTAICSFGDTDTAEAGPAPDPGEPLEFSIDNFVPVPLFQGTFFRHIERIHRLDPGAVSIASVRIPDGRYFRDDGAGRLRTGQPAARDSYLQAGALILPPGTLPRGIDWLRIHRACEPGELVHCHVTASAATASNGDPGSPSTHRAAYRVFDAEGRLVEEAVGLTLETPVAPSGGGRTPRAPHPIPIRRLQEAVRAALPEVRHALAAVSHEEAAEENPAVLVPALAGASWPAPRRAPSAHANAVAAGRAATSLGGVSGTVAVELLRDSDGRPFLRAATGGDPSWLEGLDLSLADTRGRSVALLAPAPAGVDIEPVEPREAELWRELLGPHAFALATDLAGGLDATLDHAASRVWTLQEAVKKAAGAPAAALVLLEVRGDWLVFRAAAAGDTLRILSTLVRLEDGDTAAVSLALPAGPPNLRDA